MKSNHPKQTKDNTQRQPGLQFKTTKKRTNRRPTRSKSSVSSKPTDNKQNNYELINCGENKLVDAECFYDGRKASRFDFGKNKRKPYCTEDEYAARVLERANQYNASNYFSNNYNSKGKISFIEQHQDNLVGDSVSNNSISMGHQENYQVQFRYTSPELHKNCFRGNTNTNNHVRNKTQSYDNTSHGLTPQHQKPNNFWSSRKNRNVTSFPSINQQLNQVTEVRKCKIDNFQLGLCCSEDIFGKTYPARHIPTGFVVCLKIISKREIQHDLDKFIECLKIQGWQNKENIVDIYSIFEQNGKIYVVMEYHTQGMLFMRMKPQTKMSSKDCLAYFHNICCAVRDLHLNNIAYRNMKPENISFFHDSCKISNLSWSSRLQNQKHNYLGTLEYCSPELVLGCRYNKQSDIWGLGVLLYEMVVGVPPCHNLSRKQARDKIINVQFEIHTKVNNQLARILDKIFIKDPHLRVTIQQLIQQVQQSQKIFQT